MQPNGKLWKRWRPSMVWFFFCQTFLAIYLPILGLHLNCMETGPWRSLTRNPWMFKTNMEATPFWKPNNTHNTRPTHRWIRHSGHVIIHQRGLSHHSWPLGWIHLGLKAIEGHRHEKPTNGGHWHEKPFCSSNPMEFILPTPTTCRRQVDFPHAIRGECIKTRLDISAHHGFW
jgi:hypothetical protein